MVPSWQQSHFDSRDFLDVFSQTVVRNSVSCPQGYQLIKRNHSAFIKHWGPARHQLFSWCHLKIKSLSTWHPLWQLYFWQRIFCQWWFSLHHNFDLSCMVIISINAHKNSFILVTVSMGQLWWQEKKKEENIFVFQVTFSLTNQSVHMTVSMFSVCELRAWQQVKQLSCRQYRGLMLAETYGKTPWPNPASPQLRVRHVKCCHLVGRTSLCMYLNPRIHSLSLFFFI